MSKLVQICPFRDNNFSTCGMLDCMARHISNSAGDSLHHGSGVAR